MTTVAIVDTRPETVRDDVQRVMELAEFRERLAPERQTVLLLEWHGRRGGPAAQTQPWQLDGVIGALRGADHAAAAIVPVLPTAAGEDAPRICRDHLWQGVLTEHGVDCRPLAGGDSDAAAATTNAPRLQLLFPGGIPLPAICRDRSLVLLPTLKTRSRAGIGGATAALLGLLPGSKRRPVAPHPPEPVAELLALVRAVCPTVFTICDGTVCGDGPGPRSWRPVAGNVLLAGPDPVAVDAIAARLAGLDPLRLPHLRLCYDRGLGVADPQRISVVGDARAADVRLGLRPHGSWLDRIGGRKFERQFARTPWGVLKRDYAARGGEA